uniref:Uncharacterized protein n=1 Tax=Arundo donax TaxID=35708 RepID=A0A0A9D9G0_ARUDO
MGSWRSEECSHEYGNSCFYLINGLAQTFTSVSLEAYLVKFY